MTTRHSYGLVALSMVLIILLALTALWFYIMQNNLPIPRVLNEPQLTSYDFDPCGLTDVVCEGEKVTKTVMATISTYQAVPEQTDGDNCTTANGTNACNPPYPIVAVNGLPFGTKVVIRGKVYVVADRMAKRYGPNHFDILTQGDNFLLKNEPVTLL